MPVGIFPHKKGWKHSKETKKKISLTLMGHIGAFRGKHLSKEHREKIRLTHMGSKNPMWKGGFRKSGSEYIFILNPNHPFKDNMGYVFEHRLVMEKYLGRHLKSGETVHHINGNRSDNRIENLKLFSNHSEHIKFHHKVLRFRKIHTKKPNKLK